MSSYALQNQSCYVNDEVYAEVQWNVPQLFTYEVVRVGPLVESLVHRFLGGRGHLDSVMMIVVIEKVIVRYVIVDYFFRVMVMIEWVLVVAGKLYRFRRVIVLETRWL